LVIAGLLLDMPKREKYEKRYTIGIDEVGRGALAGPVTVAAILLPQNFSMKIRVYPRLNPRISASAKLRDSKKLSPRQRELWFQYITQTNTNETRTNTDGQRQFVLRRRPTKPVSSLSRNDARRLLRGPRQSAIYYAVASVSPKVIDKIGISNAANLAASRATAKLLQYLTIVNYNSKIGIKIFLDGGLYLDKNISVNQRTHPRLSASTIIKGDEKVPAIMLASIIAKVTRDRFMLKLHKKYPQYGFDKHKGYGTKFHIKAIKKFGLSPIHRQTFKIN